QKSSWQRQGDDGSDAPWRIRLEAQGGALAVERGKASADVGEADATAGGAGKPAAGIGDGQPERVGELLRLNADGAALGERCDAVLDRVLDQRGEHHRRHARVEQARW